jgi:hypothetical protein
MFLRQLLILILGILTVRVVVVVRPFIGQTFACR